MKLERRDVENVIAAFFRRAEAARSAGGISRQEVEEGAVIPEGWKRDDQIEFWLPPNVTLL